MQVDNQFQARGGNADVERYAGRYERTSRRFDVSVRDGQLRMVLTMTGNLATAPHTST